MDERPPPEIELGAVEGDLRYWRAKEGVRQGEARLAAQLAVRTALEARATALTGWAAVSLLAAAGASVTARSSFSVVSAIVAGLVLFASAATGIYAARPQDWALVGYDPVVLASSTLASELEHLEANGDGLGVGFRQNNLRLERLAKLLRLAGWLLIAAPICGGTAYISAIWSIG